MRPDLHRRHEDEERRYFPEWAARPMESGPEIEADRNSYLAGGYSEEFGYHARPGFSREVRFVDDEIPEACPQWLVQRHAVHPGYPECANPMGPFSSNVEIRTSLRAANVETQVEPGEVIEVSTLRLQTKSMGDRLHRRWLHLKTIILSSQRLSLVCVALLLIAACKPNPPEPQKREPSEPPEPKSIHQNSLWSSYAYDESGLYSFLRRTRSP